MLEYCFGRIFTFSVEMLLLLINFLFQNIQELMKHLIVWLHVEGAK